MPWSQIDVMKERVKFVLEWERRWKETHGGRVDVAELCRMFGVSRPTGYLWIARYRDAGHDIARSRIARVDRTRIRAPCPSMSMSTSSPRVKSDHDGALASCARGSPVAIRAACGRARAASLAS